MSKSYIKFNLILEKPKTNVYNVINRKSGDLLGFIKWYGPWRQYCFFPIGSTIYSKGCMEHINEYITKLMEERKK